jgi:hypothetical protein
VKVELIFTAINVRHSLLENLNFWLVRRRIRGGRCFGAGVDVMITIFDEKIGVFSKTNVMIQIWHNLAVFWVKNANFFATFFGENICKILTSVPGWRKIQVYTCPNTYVGSQIIKRNASRSSWQEPVLKSISCENWVPIPGAWQSCRTNWNKPDGSGVNP